MSDKNTIDGKVFDFAYELAMRDATMRTAFTGATIYALLGKRNPNTKCDATSEQKENALRAKHAVWRYIEGIRTSKGYKDKDEHDAIFLKTVKKVIEAFEGYRDGDSSFTFGNTQKLINMTAKYIALGIYMDDCRENFQYCHCPMDGIMVDRVTKLAGRLVDEGEEGLRTSLEKFAYKRPRAHDWAAKGEVRWSKLTLENRKLYEGFQKVVRALAEREGLSPLELDFCVWGSDGDER